MTVLLRGSLLPTGLVICLCAGCVVPQPPGKGKLSLEKEQSLNWHYWLYLPEEYKAQQDQGNQRPIHPTTQNGLWPLVVSFHGMKPFDNCLPQAQEWQQEADRYGFIMIAPQLNTSDITMQFPLRDATLWYVQNDEKRSLAIIHEVMAKYPVDRRRVLSTSWSSGGYMAHYMVNRHPQLFSCLAVRQSNFSASMLDPKQCHLYRRMPIGIFWTQNDFPICQAESRDAVAWYRSHGFRDVSWGVFKGLGHERTPQSAAALFAIQCNIRPKQEAKFPDLVEHHGRLRQAVAYAMRPAPRPGVAVASRNGELARHTLADASSSRGQVEGTPGSPIRQTEKARAPVGQPRRYRADEPTQARPAPRPGPEPTAQPPRDRSAPPPAPTDQRRQAWVSRSDSTSSGQTTAARIPYRKSPNTPETALTPSRDVKIAQASARPSDHRSAWQNNPVTEVTPSAEQQKAPPAPVVRQPEPPLQEPAKRPNPPPTPPEVSTSIVGVPARITTVGSQHSAKAPTRNVAQPTAILQPTDFGAGHVPKPSAPSAKVPTEPAARPAQASYAEVTRAEPAPPSRVKAYRRQGSEPIRLSSRHQPLAQPARRTQAVPEPYAQTSSVPGKVEVRLTPTIGRSPCIVSFKALLPRSVAKDADFLWTDNGMPLTNGQIVDKVLVQPGQHRIEVLVITADNREFRGGGVVTILPNSGPR